MIVQKQTPKIIDRRVLIHNKEEKIEVNEAEDLILKSENNISTFNEIAPFHNLLFLFGELGSGKSTLVANYLIKIIETCEESIGFLIPAKFFLTEEFNTITDFLEKISLFINKEVISSTESFDFRDALNGGLELTIIIDGFDEVDRQLSQNLLKYAEVAVEKWKNLKIISTGRPVELKGLNYYKWQCLKIADLDKTEQEQLLTNEALSEGAAENQAKLDSQKRINLLYQNIELKNIANTPLVMRLLRPHLNNGQNKSLGDLLYEIIKEKLGEWDSKDGKEISIEDFKRAYPDVAAREVLLGIIAKKINDSPKKSISREALQALLQRNIIDSSNKNAIVTQALEFFCKSLLVEESGVVTFPSQPIFQCALGCYILNQLINQRLFDPLITDIKYWREFSFAAAIARRKGLFSELRLNFEGYLENVIKVNGGTTAGAMIASEARDEKLAIKVIEMLGDGDFRPIRYINDMETESILSFANVIHLANEKGFDWFYEQYLDPKYPLDGLDYSKDYIISVLQYWLIKKDFQIEGEQRRKLSDLFILLLGHDRRVSYLLQTLCVLFPNLILDTKTRLVYIAKSLAVSNLEERAKSIIISEFQKENNQLVLDVLAQENNINASCLWLNLCKDEPKLPIVQSIIDNSLFPQWEFLFEELKKRMGINKTINLLKWFTFQHNNRLSTKAAILLFRHGEKSLGLLGKSLIRGLHDGGKIQEAESVLEILVRDNNEFGIKWIVESFVSNGMERGAHSACWRILLTRLIQSDKEYLKEFENVIPYIGEFILPRYPDIRRKFKDLLEQKPGYRTLLISLLDSHSMLTRYNSACVLFNCYPTEESRACEIIIRSTVTSPVNHHEWLKFCMSLNIGEAVLKHIEKLLDVLNGVQEIFALSLLYHNNYQISSDNKRQMVEGLLGDASSLDMVPVSSQSSNIKRILEDNAVFDELKRILNSEDVEMSEKAAEILLNFHNSKLSKEEQLKCLLLCCKNLSWDLGILYNIKDIISKNEVLLEFAQKFIIELKEKVKRETVVAMYLRTLQDEQAWEDFLWEGLCKENHTSYLSARHFCLWLFNECRKQPDIKDIIGKAAQKFLNDDRMTSEKKNNNTIYWLAFFASEFGNIGNDKLIEIIKSYEPSDKGLYISILSRVEPSFRLNKGIVFPENREIIDGKETILEIIRDSKEIHPRFIECINSILCYEFFTEEELEKLPEVSKFGSLLSLIVQYFLYNRCNLDLLSEVFIEIEEIFIYSRREEHYYIAEETVNYIKEFAISKSTSKEMYLTKLSHVLENTSDSRTIQVFGELLKYDFSITNEMWSKFLEVIPQYSYLIRGNLVKHIVNYFISNKENINWELVLKDMKKVASSLYFMNQDRYSYNTGLPELLFALLILYKEEDDELAINLFLLGLREIFIDRNVTLGAGNQRIEYFKAADILNILEPLISSVSPRVIKNAIMRGIDSDIRELSTFCKLLYSINSSL
ncbi:NACHT domain-containing protein [Bacillus thuringiensis]|uniref:NACHT domain-containing protein n=1 Tax=Bacillus thuringiensis TaxID=1428 RepID=UPI000BFA667F|nr:hypothetical protein [Bacillus thuringiensis]PET17060.1 hypothetical protein CN517_21255 [Bacillus thuringiensis]